MPAVILYVRTPLMKRLAVAAALLVLSAGPALAQATHSVERNAVEAHMAFLAGPELQGRGSASRDEAIAAAYVATQFRLAGLTPVPGMDGYLQRAPVVISTPSGASTLSVGGVTLHEGADYVLMAGGLAPVTGALAATEVTDPAHVAPGEVLLAAPPEGPAFRSWFGPLGGSGARVIVLRRTEALGQFSAGLHAGDPVIRLADAPARPRPVYLIATAEAYDRLKGASGEVRYDPGAASVVEGVTTNAIGWLPGTDPDAGTIMVSAHLDHLGVQSDGVVMYGANDDASGTVAVIELARALSGTGPHRMNVMFVAYGSEEAGLLGSRYFVAHPPVPLDTIRANLEIEMIADQDPQLPAGVMMMTGFERSNFGPELKARGALIGPDPYPEQNFFQRSDNYALAQRGVVAHTISGWATIPTYHTAEDTLDNINFDFMTQAIQSLVVPLTALAEGDFVPTWADGGRPPAQ